MAGVSELMAVAASLTSTTSARVPDREDEFFADLLARKQLDVVVDFGFEAVFLDFDAIAAGLEIGDEEVAVVIGGVGEGGAFVLVCDFDFGDGDDAA